MGGDDRPTFREISTKISEYETLQRMFDQIEKAGDDNSWNLRAVLVGAGPVVTYKTKDELPHLLEILADRRKELLEELEEMGIVRDRK